MEIRDLTKAEEEIMQQLWDMESGFVKDVIARLPEPKPAYNTVSTIIRILETKGFIDHNAYGKSYEYFPIVSKDQYRQFAASKLVNNYFDNSLSSMLSFFAKKEKIDLKEADEIFKILEKIQKEE
jgi:BlaI family transcriptional regulator, penicillinase repressor